MKVETLFNPVFWMAYHKVLNQDMPVKHGLQLQRVLDKLGEEHKRVEKMKDSLFTKFAVLGEDGKPIVNDKNEVGFESDEKRDAFEVAIKELFDVDVDVELHKLPKSVYEELKLTPVESRVLRDHIFEPDPK